MISKKYTEYVNSQVPWIGVIPATWKVVPLKKVCTDSCLYGANVPASEYRTVGIRFIRTNDITENGLLKQRGVYLAKDKASNYILDDCDLLLSRSGTIGRSFLYEKNKHGPCCYAGYLVNHKFGSCYNAKYAYYFTKSISFNDFVRVTVISSTIDNLNGSKYANMPIVQPPLTEQKQIARYLDYKNYQINKYIRIKKRQIELLKELKQTIINDAVTGKIDVRTGKPYSKYKDSGIDGLGMIPVDWNVVSLMKHSIELSDYRGATPEKVDDGIFLLTARNIALGYIDYECSKEYVTKSGYDKIMRRGIPKLGDIVFTMEAPLGHAALIDNDSVCIAQRVIRIRVDESLLDRDYALNAIISRYFQDQLEYLKTGSTAKGIKASKLNKLLILKNTLEEQRSIASYIRSKNASINQVISQLSSSINGMIELQTRLISDVVTGKLDVRDIEVPDVPDEEYVEEQEEDTELMEEASVED